MEDKRGNWRSWYEFLFSIVGLMVGLGNIWRFPYICYKNGGGAFLVPYVISIVLFALPVMFLQLSYSQYSNLGPGKVWICCPLFKGIGYGMVTLTFIVSLYYNVILAWTLYYLGNSFFPTIPWGHCDNDWNTDACFTRGSGNTVTNVSFVNSTASNISTNATSDHQRKSSTEEFWEYNVLEISKDLDDVGVVRWQLLLCLFIAWFVVLLCLIKGIKTSGKVMYVAATIPYVFLTILLIKGLMLPGAVDGIKYFLIPRWHDLLKFSVWGDAAVQVFYSHGLGTGGTATLASYNYFHNNCYRDAIILPIIDVFTSMFAGMVIFATLGFMANEANVDIGTVVKDGPGIAFMVYPEALSKLPLPQLWSTMFFFMLFTLGLDTQIGHVQTITGALIDNFPHYLQRKKFLITAVLCLIGFVCGIPCVTQVYVGYTVGNAVIPSRLVPDGITYVSNSISNIYMSEPQNTGGVYILTLIDWYCASISIIFLALMENFVLAWLYGVDRLFEDIEMMLGYKPSSLWRVMWKCVTPLITLIVWLWSVIHIKPVRYGNYVYPMVAVGIGWIIALTPITPIPIGITHTLCHVQGSLMKRLRCSVKPTKAWKPATSAQGKDRLLGDGEKEAHVTRNNVIKEMNV